MADPTPVQPMDSSKENSPVAGPLTDEATVMLDTAKTTCMWNSDSYIEGARIKDGHGVYECNYGQWVKQD